MSKIKWGLYEVNELGFARYMGLYDHIEGEVDLLRGVV